MSSDILTVQIDRATWRYGGEQFNVRDGITALLNEQGNRCCLGFVASACGISDDMLLCSGEPHEIGVPVPRLTKTYDEGFDEDGRPMQGEKNTKLSLDAIDINDNADLMPDEREQFLKELFAPEGINLEFVGEYPAAS